MSNVKKLKNFKLSDHTSLKIGGSAQSVCEITSPVDIQDFILEFGDKDFFVLGGGSNIVAPDHEIKTPIAFMKIVKQNTKLDNDFIEITAGAGLLWDEFVEDVVDQGFAGIETLSGIPGTVGATPIQNVGAYGSEVKSTIKSVQIVDGSTGKIRQLTNEDLKFGYRTSSLKNMQSKFIIENVTFRFKKSKESNLTNYLEVAKFLNINPGSFVPIKELRKAIIEIRKSKGMVLDPKDSDTYSVGSFFINPVLPKNEIPENAPIYDAPDGKHKTSAAWLIEQAGFNKGYKLKNAYISNKHTLAICNSGNATAQEIISLAEKIKSGVLDKFKIELQIEPKILKIN
ncbi:MAG: UDP-N-acetylmuramate dehydrogenase [Candidatus Nanopelagicales bacterium]